MDKLIAIVAILAAGLTNAAEAQGIDQSRSSHPAHQGKTLDLTKPFHTRSSWRLVVTEGTPVRDFGDNEAPGALTLCLYKVLRGPCLSDPVTLPLHPPDPDYAVAWEPHYLIKAAIVYPHGPAAAPFLLLVTGSLYSGDGDQLRSTQLVSYDADKDMFQRVYGQSTGHNNNQEIRFVTDGPLRGSVISAEPQEHLPYGFWIVVNQLTPQGTYHQVLRYASATRYNDGNPLAVIDSEMPNIQNRLAMWKPGEPIRTPKSKPCPKPSLRNTELWCR